MLNSLTIDVEDYYQVSAFEPVVRYADWHRYESRVEVNTYRTLDLLEEYKTTATFFVLGWVAERHPELIREIDQLGHEVACHGYSHKLIYDQTRYEFREETKRAKACIEDAVQKPVLGYRAASYSITQKSLWALDVLAEQGFQYDSSIFPIRHDRYGIPGFPRFPHRLNMNGGPPLIEFPPTTFLWGPFTLPTAGGGYLRLLPRIFVLWTIRQIHKRDKEPVMVYFHPWELDPGQPRIHGNWISKFRHYGNLHKTEAKLILLLHAFRFAPMREVLIDRGLLEEPAAEAGPEILNKQTQPTVRTPLWKQQDLQA
jgi:polysaccharide deacetylase family protein (PEP-CTERM system associated)